jgi:tetratricopeptide (TPR) repeat protein
MHLKEAVAAFRAALPKLTPERARDSAITQINLGNTLMSLGEREGGTAYFGEAVSAYRAALNEQARYQSLLDWATTQMKLGNALTRLGTELTRLGESENGAAKLKEALNAYNAGLRVLPGGSLSSNELAEAARRRIGEIQAELAKLQR